MKQPCHNTEDSFLPCKALGSSSKQKSSNIQQVLRLPASRPNTVHQAVIDKISTLDHQILVPTNSRVQGWVQCKFDNAMKTTSCCAAGLQLPPHESPMCDEWDESSDCIRRSEKMVCRCHRCEIVNNKLIMKKR